MMNNTKINTSSLGLFRFLAIVTIIFIHYGDKIESLYIFPNFITRGGSVINFFFVLSGFGLYLNYQRYGIIDLKQYFFKRTVRILPLYYIALTMMALPPIVSGHLSFIELFLSAFCVQSWVPNYQYSINPPGWFVSNLLFFYAVFPAIFFWLTKKAPDAIKTLWSSILLWIVSLCILNLGASNLPSSYYNFIDCFPLSHLPSFYMGICGAYFVRNKKTEIDTIKINSALFSSLIVFLCSATFVFHHNALGEILNLKIPFEANLYAPLFLLFIVNLSTAENRLTKSLSLPGFVFLGGISYSIYIFQAPLYAGYWHFIAEPMRLEPWPEFLCFLLLSMIVATGLTAIENYFLDKINKMASFNRARVGSVS